MTTNTHNTDPALQQYLNSIGQSEHPVLTALRERTQSHRLGKMAIAQEQATMLAWLAKLLNAKNIWKLASLPVTAAPPWRSPSPKTAKSRLATLM